MNYAVIKTGGKQYLVTPGQKVRVEKLPGKVGDAVSFDALLSVDGKEVSVGQPAVSGASVKASIVEHGRAKKVEVVKYKPKVRYRRRAGHRQQFTTIEIK